MLIFSSNAHPLCAHVTLFHCPSHHKRLRRPVKNRRDTKCSPRKFILALKLSTLGQASRKFSGRDEMRFLLRFKIFSSFRLNGEHLPAILFLVRDKKRRQKRGLDPINSHAFNKTKLCPQRMHQNNFKISVEISINWQKLQHILPQYSIITFLLKICDCSNVSIFSTLESRT